MHLVKIFDLSTIPVFWNWLTFDSQKLSENSTYFWQSNILPKDQNIPENVKNSSTFFAFQRYLFKIDSFFWHFIQMSQKNIRYMPQKATKWPKFDQKWHKFDPKSRKLYRDFRLSTFDHRLSTVDFRQLTYVKYVSKYSSFYFHESWYNFAKLYRSSKVLP